MRVMLTMIIAGALVAGAPVLAQEEAPAAEAPAQAQPAQTLERVEEELVALYRFDTAIEDRVIPDATTPVGGLDLVIQGATAGPPVELREGAVHFAPPGIAEIPGVFSAGPATSIVEAVRRADQVTLEAWLTPARADLEGPARIVTISRDSASRNITLGQSNDHYILRLRTSATNEQGTPELVAPEGSLTPGELQHVVVTFDGQTAVMYIDGEALCQTNHFAGTLDTWDESISLVLGNEFDDNRRWMGAIHLVAIYSYALSPDQVRTNFEAGL